MTETLHDRRPNWQITDTCPRCGCRALVVEGYRKPGVDRLITQAFCTSCGLVGMEPR